MPADNQPPESQNDEASSHFDPTVRRHDDVALEQTQPQPKQEQEQQPAAIDNNVDNPNQSLPQTQLQNDVQKQEDDAVLEDDLEFSDTEDPPQEFAYVDLQAIRKEVQCPICLGIIKKTRTVMECLHRFCRECIDKSMRMGNNECPACRTHCASRRSLRDDPRYDELIAALYPDIKKFEEEELAFYEEDETRNKQIQESITQVIMKQSEALGKKRPASKDSPGTSVGRPQRTNRSTYSRRRRRRRRTGSAEYQESDDNNDANDSDKHLSPDEHHQEINSRKRKSRASIGASQSPSATNLSGGSPENNVEQNKEEGGLSPGLTCSTEMLAWGRGGVRSNTRHGNFNGGMSRNARRIRLAKLVDFLRNLEENDDECMGLETPIKDENVQQLGVLGPNGSFDHQSKPQPLSYSNDKPTQVVDSLQDRLHVLNREETLSGAVASCVSNAEQLILAYQQKEAM